jgi:hypothetical protein
VILEEEEEEEEDSQSVAEFSIKPVRVKEEEHSCDRTTHN